MLASVGVVYLIAKCCCSIMHAYGCYEILFIIVVATCEDKDTDYFGNQLYTIENIDSWLTCSNHCRFLSACSAWVWISNLYKVVAYRQTCHLKTEISGRNSLAGVISGNRDCGSSISKLCASLYLL